MGPRLRIGLLIAAFALVGADAWGQSAKPSGAAIDAMPKHPIPYQELKRLTAKPRPRPKPKPAPATALAGAAQPGAPQPVGAAPPLVGAKPAPSAGPIKPPVPKPPTPAAPTVAKPAPPIAKPPAPPPAKAPAPPTPPHPAAKLVPPPPTGPPPSPLPTVAQSGRLAASQAVGAAELQAFVDGQVWRAMSADHIAGAAVAVVQNGQLVMEKGYGVAAAAPARGMDPRATLVRLGSASQLFTWIAVLKAVEDGRLNLDAPVNSYLPDELKIPDEGFDRPVLLRHLMSHTAGFEDRALGRRYVRNAEAVRSLDEGLQHLRPRRVRAAGLLSIPSDYGAALAGGAVAKAENQPFDQLIENQILKPLALSHTSFREPYPASSGLPDPLGKSLADGLGDGFLWTSRGLEPQPFAFGQSLAPAIAASTTADDMARLMIALLNNGKLGEATLYGPKTATLLRAPLQHPAPGMDGWAHGLAMQTFPGGLQALSQAGSALTFHSNLTLIPSLNMGVFVVANTDTGGDLVGALPSAVVQRFYAGPPAPGPAAPGDDVDRTGAYLSAQRAYHGLEAFVARLTRQSTLTVDSGGDLVLSNGGRQEVYAPTVVADRYRSSDGGALYTPTAGGRARAYVLSGGAAERVGGVHSDATLIFWAAAAAFTVFASFAGLFIRDRVDVRETRSQTAANVLQIVGCIAWCAAFGAFGLFVRGDLSAAKLMFDWPNRWLVAASWSALIAGALALAMAVQLPGAWREERRIHGWSVWRKLRHTAAVGVFLVFTAVLAAWGALEPWSS